MKATLKLLPIAIAGMLVLPGCQEDDPVSSPAAIQFTGSVQKAVEGEQVIISLALDKAAPASGSVEVTFQTDAIYDQHYLTFPTSGNGSVSLKIYKGNKSATLTISAIDNANYEGSRLMVLRLQNPAGGVALGTITTSSLVIADDESPSSVNFAQSSATLKEEDEGGITVEIPFSAPAQGEGSVTVALEAGEAVGGKHFTIDQELTGNVFSFNVQRNSTAVAFRVLPVDDDLFNGNFILRFSITDVSGVIQKGNGEEFVLTLMDDEAPSVAMFAMPSGNIAESNTAGIEVAISLSSPVKGEGTIMISLASQNLIYGTHFITAPAAQDNSIMLALSHDQVGTSFTVFPLNDDIPSEDQAVSFLIKAASGVVWKGSDGLTYTLTIADDD